jgi:PAS domain S-box-containing protein
MTAGSWPELSRLMKKGEKTGRAFPSPDYEMTLARSGDNVLEECYFDGVCVPIRGKADEVEGFYNSRYEVTRVKMMERRAKLLHMISVMPDFKVTTPWQHILESCEPHTRDVSMLGLYSAIEEDCANVKTCKLNFEGGLGLKAGEQGFKQSCDLYSSKDPLMRALRQAKSTKAPVVLGPDQPHPFIDGVIWRAWGEPSGVLIIAPIMVFGMIAGFIVAGMNPRRPYDEDHERFGEDLCQVATTVLCASISYSEARAREVELMRQVSSSQRFIAKLADVATVGMYSLSHEGYLAWANPRYYEIVGVPSDEDSGTYEATLVHVCDSGEALQIIQQCKDTRKSVTSELRLRTKWMPPGSVVEEHMWILASATPDIDEQGRVGIVGCVTDIKEIKWSEKLQQDAAEVAREAKRQHERFIDSKTLSTS